MSNAPLSAQASFTALANGLKSGDATPLALNRLEDNRGGRRGDGVAQSSRIVGRDKCNTRQQRLERFPIMGIGSHRQRAIGPAMKRAFECDELLICSCAPFVCQ